jgi:hypothetical protein
MIMAMGNSNDTIVIRTCDLLACSAVPQPTAPQKKDCEKQICTDVLLRNSAVEGTKGWREGDN